MTLWAASRLATRWFSPQTGWWTVLILASSYLFWNKGGFGQIDALLCGLEMMALYFLFTANDQASTPRLVAAYVFMGLGVLAKGPVGFIVPLGVYLTAVHTSGEWRKLSHRHLLWGPVITLMFPGLWLLLIWLQGAPDGFFHELLFKQNVGRAVGEFGGHIKPFYYFLQYFPLDFLPWTILLPVSYLALSRIPEQDMHRRRLMAWIIFVILFFSLSASKRNLYILLAYPGAAILVSAGIEYWRLVSRSWRQVSFYGLWGIFIVLGICMLVGSFVRLPIMNTRMLMPGGLAMMVGVITAWICWRRFSNHKGWLAAFSVSMLLAFTSIGALVYPELNDMKTPDELVDTARKVLAPDDRMILYKQNGEIYSLYSGRLGFIALTHEDFIQRLISETQTNHLIVAYERDLPAIFRVIDGGYPVTRFEMGNKKLAWIVIEGVPRLRENYRDSMAIDDASGNGQVDAKSSSAE